MTRCSHMGTSICATLPHLLHWLTYCNICLAHSHWRKHGTPSYMSHLLLILVHWSVELANPWPFISWSFHSCDTMYAVSPIYHYVSHGIHVGATNVCMPYIMFVARLFKRSARNTVGTRATPEWQTGLVAPLVRGPKCGWGPWTLETPLINRN